MKTIVDYLNQAKAITGSDRQTAIRLGISSAHISTFRGGKSISDDLCLKLADLLNIDVLEVLAAKNAERTKSPEMKKKWTDVYKHVAAVLILTLAGLVHSPSEVQAAPAELNNNMYYAHKRRRWLIWLIEAITGISVPVTCLDF